MLTYSTLRDKIKLKFFKITNKQLGEKLRRHVGEYNLNPALESDRNEFKKIAKHIVANASERRTGFWRGQDEDVIFYIYGNDVVLTKQDNEFITLMKDGVNNVRVKNARVKKV